MDGDGSADFGALLRRYRVVAGLTQEGLADRAGVSVRSVRYIERGVEHAPHRDTVRLLADAMALSPSERDALVTAAAHWGRQPRSMSRATNPQHTLPAPPSPLFGRADDVARVSALLCRQDVRLVTLTGPAGVGKTRLALHVARAVASHVPDGVAMVALAATRDPAFVISAIARALGVRQDGAPSMTAQVHAHLQARHVLLVLDNFEQVVAAAPVVADLLAACPLVTALVTSRVRLQVRMEHAYTVSPLALPDPANLPALADLAESPAVALFVCQAHMVQADFVLTPANSAVVVEICRRLDGLPLSIELAAARITVLPPPHLLERLTHRLRLLTDGARDLPLRQQTLRNALDWSYDLLTAREQRVLRQLCVFVGGCSLTAAEGVCGWAEEEDGRFPVGILDVITSLVNQSLVQRVPQEGVGRHLRRDVRVDVLDTVREYGHERAVACGDAATLARRHASYMLALAEEAERELTGAHQAAWLDLLDADSDNLRVALRWACTCGEWAWGLRLAAALWRFWWMRGHLSEGRAWLDRLLALDATTTHAAPSETRLKALAGAGVLAAQQGEYERAVTLHEESLALARQMDAGEGMAVALNNLGNVAFRQGAYDRAIRLHQESLELAQRCGDQAGMGRALNNLGNVALFQGAYEQAATLYEQSLALARELDDIWSIGAALNNLGIAARNRHEYARATVLYEESLALQRELGETQGITRALMNLAELAHDQGDDVRAERLCRESLALRQHVGDRWGIASALALLGDIARERNDTATAYQHYVESLTLRHDLDVTPEVAHCLEGMAGAATTLGQPVRAARLLGAAAARRDAVGAPIPAADRASRTQDSAAVRVALGGDLFDAAWAEGHAWPLARILAEE